jgi:bacterioferritin-associated ferredoxin
MIVCHCRAVGHRIVQQAIDDGATDAEAVAAHCGAGSVCGGCRPTVESFLAAARPADCRVDVRSAVGALG